MSWSLCSSISTLTSSAQYVKRLQQSATTATQAVSWLHASTPAVSSYPDRGNKKWTGNDIGLLDGTRSAGVDAVASMPQFWRILRRNTLSWHDLRLSGLIKGHCALSSISRLSGPSQEPFPTDQPQDSFLGFHFFDHFFVSITHFCFSLSFAQCSWFMAAESRYGGFDEGTHTASHHDMIARDYLNLETTCCTNQQRCSPGSEQACFSFSHFRRIDSHFPRLTLIVVDTIPSIQPTCGQRVARPNMRPNTCKILTEDSGASKCQKANT